MADKFIITNVYATLESRANASIGTPVAAHSLGSVRNRANYRESIRAGSGCGRCFDLDLGSSMGSSVRRRTDRAPKRARP